MAVNSTTEIREDDEATGAWESTEEAREQILREQGAIRPLSEWNDFDERSYAEVVDALRGVGF